jgi:molybdopterin molybdotransferase
VPTGADAVIPQEEVEERAQLAIRTLADVQPGEHVRPAGEVMSAGTRILARGSALGPAELAVAISAGAGEVAVGRRPRTHILATGDELRDPGESLGPGQIHDSNGPMLAGLAGHAGAIASGTTRLPDDRLATEQGLAAALEDADVVIVSGGVSVGPHDHVKPALERLGVRERFWGVALQPGKPTWFGVRGGKLVFGLPGNPVSAAVTFSLFVAPAITALQGGPVGAGAFGQAALGEPVRQNRRRQQAVRVRLERRDGEIVAIPNGPQGSHVITSLIGADALALIPQGDSVLEAGTVVGLQPLPR